MANHFVIESAEELFGKDSKSAVSHPMLFNFAHGENPMGRKPPNLNMVLDPDQAGSKILQCAAGGTEWEAREGTTAQEMIFCIGIRSKKNGTMRLVEIESQHLMRPRVLAHPSAQQASNSSIPAPKKSYVEKRSHLMATFGGSRTKNRYAAYRRDQYRDGLVKQEYTSNVVDAAAKQLADDEKEKGVSHLSSRTVAPPHNIEAKDPSEAYPLDGLMSPLEWEAIKQQADQYIRNFDSSEHGGMAAPAGWHPLTWKLMIQTLSAKEIDETTRHTRIMADLYLNILITLANGPHIYSGAVKEQLQEKLYINEDHVSVLLESFSEKQFDDKGSVQFRRGPVSDDKVRYFAIVAWLTALGFVHCGTIGDLARALGTTSKVLAQCAVCIGGKLYKKKTAERTYDTFTVSLLVPLKFPALSKKKRSGRKRTRPG